MLFFTSHGMLCFKKALLFSLMGKHIVRRGSESCGYKFQGGSYKYQKDVPRRGIASDTCGRVSCTKFCKTVSESRMVTPGKQHIQLSIFYHGLHHENNA